MSELIEFIAPPNIHFTDADKNCPFCFCKEEVVQTTNVTGDAIKLRKNLKGNNIKYEDGTSGNWEAHHLIPTKTMKESKFRRWILQVEGKIIADTGYDIDKPENGKFLPSKGDPGEKMNLYKLQFHHGNHFNSYFNYVNKMLYVMNLRVMAWQILCRGEGKSQPNNKKVNSYMDNLSDAVLSKISGEASEWEIFVSRKAYDYHKAVCKKHPNTSKPDPGKHKNYFGPKATNEERFNHIISGS